MPKRTIHLHPSERDTLTQLVSRGRNHVSVLKRAYMLLHSDAGLTDEAIAQFLLCSEDTVRRTRIRYLSEGLDAALEDKPRPGPEPLLKALSVALMRVTPFTSTLRLEPFARRVSVYHVPFE
jgi:hypothetical protein